MKITIWPWVKKVVGRGRARYVDKCFGVIHLSFFESDYVDYEITNTWTGSVTIKRVYLN